MSHLYKPCEDTYTSKGRHKVSTYETSFFNTFQFNKETDIWSEKVTNGGSATFDSSISGITMAVTNQVGSEIIRQTKNVMRYVPGRSSTLSFAVRLQNPVTGIRRRFGLFDEDNGAYFEDGGDGTYYCCIRNKNGITGPTLERIARANWNGDKLDGNGVSGITASATAQQLINIEYEWYGAGQVVFSYVINGKSYIIHTFDNGNRLDHPWCSTPFLPIRLELTNVTGVAGTHYMYQGSNSLISEGASEILGISESITNAGLSTDLVYRPLANAGQFYPMISIRLKSTQLSGVVLPGSFQAATIDNVGLGYKLIKNPNLVGAAFTSAPDSNAFTEIDVSATSFTNGDIIDSGFIVGGTSGGIALNQNISLQLGRVGIGTTMTSDVLTLAVAYIAKSNSAKDAVASLTWIEQR